MTAWQHALIDYVKSYEATKPKQHPVGMTWQWPGGSNSTDLYTSNADWVSYGANDATPLTNPVVWPDTGASGKVSLWDTDHMGGTTGLSVPTFPWRALCRGHNPLLMDKYDGTLYGGDVRSDATAEKIRYNMGYIQDYVARIDMANATPQGSLASTGYCLAKTSGRYQLIAYQPTSGNFTVDLTALSGTFNAEYLRCSTGATTTGTVTGGAVRTITAPWASEDYVVFLEVAGIDGAASITLAGITATATATVKVAGSGAATLALTATATAVVAVSGSGAVTLAGITSTATGAVAIVGSASATLAAITLTATTSTNRTGSLAATLDGLTSVAAGAVSIAGQLAATLAGATSTAAGTVAITGSAAGTVAAVTLTGTGVLGVTTIGQADVTLAPLTATATGTVGISGAGAAALQGVALTAAGSVPVVGQASATLDGITVFATTSAITFGAGAATLGDLTSTAAGVVGLIIAVVTGTVRGASASGTVRGAKATGTVKG